MEAMIGNVSNGNKNEEFGCYNESFGFVTFVTDVVGSLDFVGNGNENHDFVMESNRRLEICCLLLQK